MLFDLRGRGRRRAVKVIYVGLALLFGVGFIGFGVGVGGGGGGLLDALTNNNGTSGASYSSQIKKDRKLVAAEPTKAAPLATLIEDLLRQAGTGENYNSTEGAFTSKATGLLREARSNWQRYLALETKNPSSDLANEMLGVFYGPGSLNEPAAAVTAMQIVIAGRPPSDALYATLAQLAYKAGNTRQGDLASQKAVSLAPKAERGLLKTRLEAIKKNPSGEEGSASGTSGATTATVSSETSTGGVAGIGVNPKKAKTVTTTSKTSTTATAKH
jgi:hypothetical protein